MTPRSASERIRAYLSPLTLTRLGVAVSGGSDSLALLSLLNAWRDEGGPEPVAVTVDHGLRPEAAEEAAEVGRLCARLDISHTILSWRGWDGRGNLHAEARRARYALMSDWAQEIGLGDIAVAHTIDDQAETFLMRLSREAGLDGLAAMAPSWTQSGVTFHRPTLGCSRADLRDHLTEQGLTWVEDPSNDDPSFERARARQVLFALKPLGIEAETLASVSVHLRAAQEVVEVETWRAAKAVATLDAGDVILDRDGFAALPDEIARRLLQEALMWISGADYPPRGSALSAALDAVRSGQGTTLMGCRVILQARSLRITREAQAVKDCVSRPGTLWDGRWRLTPPDDSEKSVEFRALGERGLTQCPAWRETGRPAPVLHASPAVWRNDTLIAAPLAGFPNGWRASVVPRARRDFAAQLVD